MRAMADVPGWRVAGDWFDLCRCHVPCGCTFAQPPDDDECQGVLAYHINEGHYGDVPLDDLNVVGIGGYEGNVWTGQVRNAALGYFIDERADESQLDAIKAIWGGQAGGWPAALAHLVQEWRGWEQARIEFEGADDLGHWRVEVPDRVRGSAATLSGPTAPEGTRVQVINAPGAEVGPGQVATYAKVDENEVEAFGFKWSWPERSSKHFPFEWSGPDPA
jgi:hypothetical protein